MIPELGLGYHQDLEGDEAGLQQQEAAHQEAGVTEQVPVAGVGGVTRLSSVHHPVRLVKFLTIHRRDGEIQWRLDCELDLTSELCSPCRGALWRSQARERRQTTGCRRRRLISRSPAWSSCQGRGWCGAAGGCRLPGSSAPGRATGSRRTW